MLNRKSAPVFKKEIQKLYTEESSQRESTHGGTLKIIVTSKHFSRNGKRSEEFSIYNKSATFYSNFSVFLSSRENIF